MKKIQSYSEMLEHIRECKRIFEKGMSPEKISKLKRLKDSGNIKDILKELNQIIDEIKDKCIKLSYDDILYRQNNDIIYLGYNGEIDSLLNVLKTQTRTISDEIDERIFGGDWHDLTLEIELDKDMLNRIDIMNGLPLFMKGLGLGKKIYKKLICDFGYISSYDGYEPSLDSSMVWESITNDKELFTFSNDENLISFWNELKYETIIEKLKEFYEHKGNAQFDDDFLAKYNLTDLSLEELLF